MALIAPHIANGMVIFINTNVLADMNKQNDELVKQGNFKGLPTLHHISAGIKALSTEMMYIANDQLRQACGGAGYTLASGIAQHVLSHSPLPTFEGVNVLMF